MNEIAGVKPAPRTFPSGVKLATALRAYVIRREGFSDGRDRHRKIRPDKARPPGGPGDGQPAAPPSSDWAGMAGATGSIETPLRASSIALRRTVIISSHTSTGTTKRVVVIACVRLSLTLPLSSGNATKVQSKGTARPYRFILNVCDVFLSATSVRPQPCGAAAPRDRTAPTPVG